MDLKLFDSYRIEVAANPKEFGEFFAASRSKVFENDIDLDLDAILSEQELNDRDE